MAVSNLPNILVNQSKILGNDFQNVGKKTGSRFLGRRKILLSYDTQNGWGVVRLNLVQLFLRRIFGFYKKTHLKQIVNKWATLSPSFKNKNVSLETKLQHFWKKVFPKKTFPNHFKAWGNAKISEAELICFAEYHDDRASREKIGGFINRHYRPGDIILVEGWETGKKGIADDCPMTEYVKRDYPIQGWDIENIDEMQEALYGIKIKELSDIYQNIIKKCPSSDSFIDEDLKSLEEEVNKLIKEYPKLAESYVSDEKLLKDTIDHDIRFFNKITTLLKTKKLTEQIDGVFSNKRSNVYFFKACFRACLINLQESFTKWGIPKTQKGIERFSEYSKNYFSAVAKSDAAWFNRNESLCTEIHKHCAPNRRVFVIAGSAHLLNKPPIPIIERVKDFVSRAISKIFRKPLPRPSKLTIENVKKALHRHQFVLLTARSISKDYKMKQSNRDLRKQNLSEAPLEAP